MFKKTQEHPFIVTVGLITLAVVNFWREQVRLTAGQVNQTTSRGRSNPDSQIIPTRYFLHLLARGKLNNTGRPPLPPPAGG